MFSEYSCSCAALRSAWVTGVSLQREKRALEVWLSCGDYLDKLELQKARREMERLYGVDSMVIHCRYEGVELTPAYAPMLAQHLGQVCPSCRGFLEDAVMRVERNMVTLELVHGGGEALLRTGAAGLLSSLLEEEFGRRYEVRFEGRLELEQLSDAAQQELLSLQQAGLRAEKAASAAKRSKGDLLFGRPVPTECIPLCEIGIDNGSVVVCGEVFGLESRISKNGKTAIVSFNLTDNTSSFPVNLFPPADKAAALLDALKDGLYLRLRGDVQIDRYTNELGIVARDIVRAEKPLRTDDAPQKRVELHLHTQLSTLDSMLNIKETVAMAKEWGIPPLPSPTTACCRPIPTPATAPKRRALPGKSSMAWRPTTSATKTGRSSKAPRSTASL